MSKVYSWIGNLVAALSIVLLIKRGFQLHSFAAPLQAALDYYERASQFLFGWAAPYLEATWRSLLGWTGWNIRLYPHWKHVFILFWLYITADALSNWRFGITIEGKKWRPRRRLALSVFAFGTFLTAAVACVAGMVDPSGSWSAIVLAAVALMSFILFEIGFNALATSFLRDSRERWYPTFRSHLAPARRLFFGSCVVLAFCVVAGRLRMFERMPNPGLIVMLVVVLVLALYRIVVGARWTHQHRGLAERWRDVFELSISGPFGLRILKAFAGALLFVLTNAGLPF